MMASSEDSLRLAWLAETFSSMVVSDGQGGGEVGISLRSAVGLIRSVNPGVRSEKVEHRFKELHRVKERMNGAGTSGVGTVAGAEAKVGASVVAVIGSGAGDEDRAPAVTGAEERDGGESGANTDTRRGIEGRVTKEEFIEVFHDLCTRPEIYFLLVQFSSNKEYLDTKDLMRFLEVEQGMAQVRMARRTNFLFYQ